VARVPDPQVKAALATPAKNGGGIHTAIQPWFQGRATPNRPGPALAPARDRFVWTFTSVDPFQLLLRLTFAGLTFRLHLPVENPFRFKLGVLPAIALTVGVAATGAGRFVANWGRLKAWARLPLPARLPAAQLCCFQRAAGPGGNPRLSDPLGLVESRAGKPLPDAPGTGPPLPPRPTAPGAFGPPGVAPRPPPPRPATAPGDRARASGIKAFQGLSLPPLQAQVGRSINGRPAPAGTKQKTALSITCPVH